MNNTRIYPSWDIIEKFEEPLSEGENALARFLDKNLDSGWKIFVKPQLNNSKPNIVIMNSKVGLMVYTVKDLKVDSNKTLTYIKQVNHYRNKIIGQLIPEMGERIDEDKRLFGIIQTGIYLHNLGGEKARELFKHPNYPVITGCDDLTPDNLDFVVPASDYKTGYMEKEHAEKIEFWLNPPFHSKRGALKLELSAKQKNHSKPKPGHRRIRGAAGSGKTLVIAYRAAKLAAEGKRVLVITFNLTLWHYIKDMIANTPFDFEWKNIVFNHFHGLCNDIINELGVEKPQNYFDEILPTVEDAVSKNDIERFKFDAILIDEGQDCKWEWYSLLSKFLNERDELLFVCDKNQNIYGRELSWIDNMGNVKFRGRWGELNTIYRLPKKIGSVANKFSKAFNLDQQLDTEEYAQLTLFERPPILKWKNIASNEWMKALKDAYSVLKYQQKGYGEGQASDIVILLPTKKMGMQAVKLFERRGIEVNHVFEVDRTSKYSRNKKAFPTNDGRLKISTIHSFKGWEAIHVIMLIPERWKGGENLDSMVYTAMTRTRKNLIVLNCNERYKEFGSNLSKTD
ncbi:UvrD-helicase domain-containing protein [Methanobacterium sp. ACI-7]|uniref:UvrD-helicase domain-containing protein n=1 Tax=unclassified Methanobacterium TaxID=2627676 RepID=UPI0039C34881